MTRREGWGDKEGEERGRSVTGRGGRDGKVKVNEQRGEV